MRDFPIYFSSTTRQTLSNSFIRRTGARLLALLVILFLLHTTAVHAEPIYRTVTIAWDASISPGITGYRVHYGTHSGDYSKLIDVGNSTSADIPNLIDGTTYFFAITAYDAANEESAPSDEMVHTVGQGVILNVSARANVQNGDDVLIAGFIIGGSSRKTMVVRALGPSLADRGIPHPLADPHLIIFGPTGGVIMTNDNWPDGTPNELSALNLTPSRLTESAVVMNLPPGAYTAIVRGSGGATGIALLEVYDVGVPAQ